MMVVSAKSSRPTTLRGWHRRVKAPLIVSAGAAQTRLREAGHKGFL